MHPSAGTGTSRTRLNVPDDLVIISIIINNNQSKCLLMPTIQIMSKTPYLMYWKLVFEGVLRDSVRPEPISVEGEPGMKIMIFDETCMNYQDEL
jgi:hypothetical protein